MNINELKKSAVLAALYNASKPQGMGFMHYDPKPMTEEEAEDILSRGTYFDYLEGRVMKIDLSKDEVDTRGYNRDNGADVAEDVIMVLRSTKDSNAPSIQTHHKQNTLESALYTESRLGEIHETETIDGMTVLTLGLSDVANELGPKVKQITRV